MDAFGPAPYMDSPKKSVATCQPGRSSRVTTNSSGNVPGLQGIADGFAIFAF